MKRSMAWRSLAAAALLALSFGALDGNARDGVDIAAAPQAEPAPAARALDGSGEAPAADPELASPHIGATDYHVWIMPKPTHEGLAFGSMRIGTAVKLKSPKPVAGEGCARGWYEVEPRGYVCLNRRTTLELGDPYYRALHSVAPNRGAIWPYRYAHSRGAPIYSRVPTPEEWAAAERGMGAPGTYAELGEWAKGHEELIEKDVKLAATDPVPWFFEGGKRHVGGGTRDVNRLVWKVIPNGSMLSYAAAFEMHGRVWLVSPDLTVVPADRVQSLRRSQFRGLELTGSVQLPLAWNRSFEGLPLVTRDSSGRTTATDEVVAGKSAIMILEKAHGTKADPYYELRDRPGRFVRGRSVAISWQKKTLPRSIKPGQKWLDAHIVPGTLTAYVGTDPVYATLFSPGKGGVPVPGNDLTKFATTEVGTFRYEWKEWAATMSNEKGDPTVLWFSDVPHIQYIHAPLAQHVAFWHEDFGDPKSAECVNVSPIDGRFLFGFTEPAVPEGWNGVGANFGPSTPIVISGL